MTQPDLLAMLTPPCSACANLDPRPINPNVHYCRGAMMWRGADERVEPCPYRRTNA